MSSNPAQFWPDRMKEAWQEAEPTSRFLWKMNGRLVALVLMSPGVLWAYYLYTWLKVGFSLGLGLFTVVYLGFTAWLIMVVMRWRAFCLQSGVAVTRGRLVWTHSGTVHEAKWSEIDPTKLGLAELGTGRRLEYAMRLPSIDGKAHPLWLFRVFGFMENLESFVQQLLERSRGGGVVVNKRSLSGAAAKTPFRAGRR